MKFEKQAEVMARCWTHMLKTGIIDHFIKNESSEMSIELPAIDQTQENKLVTALKERFLKTIEDSPKQFENHAPGLNWCFFSNDVIEALKAANIKIKNLDKIEFKSHPHIYMNNCGEVSVNNGHGCHFIYFPDSVNDQGLFSKNYLQRLNEIYNDYFDNYGFSSRYTNTKN